jgi:GNAT superfamily N-acetyltransferase
MIIKCTEKDFNDIYDIINDASIAYKGIIPEDRWHEPYMPEEELKNQIQDGVIFWGYVENDALIGVMGIQYKGDVTLIRHAYVRTSVRGKGIGGHLLAHLSSISTTPILIGTWEDAKWAIGFYLKNGYRLLERQEINILLPRYWKIPARQVETSVVLASPDWVSLLIPADK